MKHSSIRLLIAGLGLSAVGFISAADAANKTPSPAPNGIPFPKGYSDWRLIASSLRHDNDTMRVILGNPAAVKAARTGKTNPWPEGAVLAKIVWEQKSLDAWKDATVPGKLVHVEFILKDTKKFPATGGWGYARWKGPDLIPYGEDVTFAQECFSCHTAVKGRDYVFTRPAALP